MEATFKVWGVACRLQRQTGLVNSTATGTSRKWVVSSQSFQADAGNAQSIATILGSFQLKYGYRAPEATLSGLGGAIGKTALLSANANTSQVDWTAYAHSFLFASAEIERNILNLASANTSTSIQTEFKVAGRQSKLKYRITYIPFILVLALCCLTAAALAVFCITLYSWNSIPVRIRGTLDPLRLMADFAASMKNDDHIHNASHWTRKDLKKWGHVRKFHYKEAPFASGRVVLKPSRSR